MPVRSTRFFDGDLTATGGQQILITIPLLERWLIKTVFLHNASGGNEAVNQFGLYNNLTGFHVELFVPIFGVVPANTFVERVGNPTIVVGEPGDYIAFTGVNPGVQWFFSVSGAALQLP